MPTAPFRYLMFSLVVLFCVGCGESDDAPAFSRLLSPTPALAPPPSPTPSPTATPTPAPTPTPTPTPTAGATSAGAVAPGGTGPVDILEASFAAMNEAGSFHFQLDGTLKPTAGGLDLTVPIRLMGDYQAPDRVRSKLIVSLGFFALEMETITIGDTTYTLNAGSDQWEVASGPVSALPSPMEFTRGGTTVLEEAELIGEETLNGTLVHHLRVVPPLELFGGEESKTQADFWIRVDDSLIHRFAAEGEVSIDELGGLLGNAGISGTADITVTIEFSDYNVPVVIEAPQMP